MKLIRTGAIRRRSIHLARGAAKRFDDAVVVAGIASIAFGIGQYQPPLAWVFVGLALIAVVAFGRRTR